MTEDHHVLPDLRVLEPALRAEDVRVAPHRRVVLHRPRGYGHLRLGHQKESFFFGISIRD